MPAKKKSVFDELGNSAEVIARHKNDPIKTGFVQLPPGIVNGVATLTEISVGKDDEGRYVFKASAAVEEPKYVGVNGSQQKVEGLHTYNRVYVNRDTYDKDLARVVEEVRKIAGADVFDQNPDMTIDEVVAMIAAHRPPPKIRFSTSLSKPQIDPKTGKPKINPKTKKEYTEKVWENWNGVATGGGEDPTGAFNDATGGGDEDIDDLILRAKNNDDEADARLRKICGTNGYTDAEYDKAAWDRVAEMAAGKKDATPPFSVGEFVDYKVKGKKTACKVRSVDETGGTVNLVEVANPKKTHDDVPWADVEKQS